jgi:hypothetical protein
LLGNFFDSAPEPIRLAADLLALLGVLCLVARQP